MWGLWVIILSKPDKDNRQFVSKQLFDHVRTVKKIGQNKLFSIYLAALSF